MQITEVRVRKVNFEGRTRAFVSVTFDDCFAVHDLRVVEGDSGLFVAMPNRRLPNGERRDIAHPVNNDFRQTLQKAVLDAYEHAPPPEAHAH
jgi:stage V sporulation protein G